MLIIPLQAAPSQVIDVDLAGQVCRIEVYQRDTGLYLNLYNAAVQPPSLYIGGVICENLNRIVRSLYLGFSGDLVFADTQGDEDPIFTGLGTRFLLGYLTAAELAGVG